MDVPLYVLVEPGRFDAAVIELPGAKMSTHLPVLLNDERASCCVVEPTVIADSAAAGE